MITRKDGIQQMGVRTAILALFIGFFLIIARVSTQALPPPNEQMDGAYPIPAPIVVSTFNKIVPATPYDLPLNFRQILLGYNC